MHVTRTLIRLIFLMSACERLNSAVFQICSFIDLNSIYSDSIYQSSPETADSRRIFRLENCNIRSEIGWMKHQDYILSDVAKEFVHGLKEYFSKSGI